MTLTFCPYKQDDLSWYAELSASAWPIVTRLTKKGDLTSFIRAYVTLSLVASDYTEVCCDGDKVIGLLFGATGNTPPSPEKRQESRKVLWAFIGGKYGRIKHHLRFLVGFVLSAVKFEYLCSRFDSEVTCIDHARQNNHGTVYLGTDVESS